MDDRLTLYAVLGVAPDATFEDIRRAFRRLARSSHPDASADTTADSAGFRDILRAYEILSDPAARRGYDRSLDPASTAGSERVDVRSRANRRPADPDGDTPGRTTACPMCAGRQEVTAVADCPACAASGLAVEIGMRGARRHSCPACRGSGSIRRVTACPRCRQDRRSG